MKTIEQMIEVIYEEIANKELSFSCNVKVETSSYWRTGKFIKETNDIVKYIDSNDWEEQIQDYNNIYNEMEIIWHPVMIWDVLDWMEQRVTDVVWMPLFMWIMQSTWKHKRKPIEDQSEECITYIYNLIKW